MSKDELEKENAELKKEVEKHKWNDIFLEDCAGYDKKIAEEYTTLQERIEKLEKENAELKRRLDNLFNSDCWASEKLTKAKELLEDLVRFQPYIDREAIFHSIGNEWKTAIYKAEQFLKGENIILEDAQAGNSPFDADEVFNKEMKAYTEEK